MSGLKRTNKDATNLQQAVEILRARTCTGTNVDTAVAHSQIHVQLVYIALVEGNVMLAQQATTFLRVCYILRPKFQAIIDALS